MSEIDQIGLFEVEYLVPYFIFDMDQSGPKCSTSKNAVTSKSEFKSVNVIENDSSYS